MPTALRVGPYRFFFYSGDGTEPIHMHVERDDDEAKFWLEPVRIERSKGFSRKELREIERIIVDQHALLGRSGMNTSELESVAVNAITVMVSDDTLTVELSDGRSVAAPLVWFPRLLHGTNAERSEYRLIGQGSGIHWPQLDEDISVNNLLQGKRSQESQVSLKRWLEQRQG